MVSEILRFSSSLFSIIVLFITSILHIFTVRALPLIHRADHSNGGAAVVVLDSLCPGQMLMEGRGQLLSRFHGMGRKIGEWIVPIVVVREDLENHDHLVGQILL